MATGERRHSKNGFSLSSQRPTPQPAHVHKCKHRKIEEHRHRHYIHHHHHYRQVTAARHNNTITIIEERMKKPHASLIDGLLSYCLVHKKKFIGKINF